MKIYEFNDYFPDEASCRAKFKEIRIRQGVVCPLCGMHVSHHEEDILSFTKAE